MGCIFFFFACAKKKIEVSFTWHKIHHFKVYEVTALIHACFLVLLFFFSVYFSLKKDCLTVSYWFLQYNSASQCFWQSSWKNLRVVKTTFSVLKKREKWKVWSLGSHPWHTEGTNMGTPGSRQKASASKEPGDYADFPRAPYSAFQN